jgi:hypothetical protein
MAADTWLRFDLPIDAFGRWALRSSTGQALFIRLSEGDAVILRGPPAGMQIVFDKKGWRH